MTHSLYVQVLPNIHLPTLTHYLLQLRKSTSRYRRSRNSCSHLLPLTKGFLNLLTQEPYIITHPKECDWSPYLHLLPLIQGQGQIQGAEIGQGHPVVTHVTAVVCHIAVGVVARVVNRTVGEKGNISINIRHYQLSQCYR